MKRPTVRLFLHTLQKEWLLSGVTLLVCIGSIILPLLAPMVLGNMIDQMTVSKEVSFSGIWLYGLLLFLCACVDSSKEGLFVILGQKVIFAMRKALSEKLTRLPYRELALEQSGEIVSRFVGDVNMIESLFTSGIIGMVLDSCKLIALIWMIFLKNEGLSLLMLVVMPSLYFFTRFVQKRMYLAQKEARLASADMSAQIPETIQNIRTIHNLAKKDYMQQRYAKGLENSFAAISHTNFYDAVYSPVILFCNAIVVCIVMLCACSNHPVLMMLFGMSAGTAVTLFNWISQIFSPIEAIGMEIQTMQSAMASMSRVDEFLKKEEMEVVGREMPLDESLPCIVFDHVTFGYEKTQVVLDDFSLRVEKGEQVYLAGRTGSGKSTVFKLLYGLYPVEKGEIRVYGVPVNCLTTLQKRALFGYVEQSFQLVPGTIYDQITVYDTSITEQQVEEAAKLVGLHEVILSFPNQYHTVCTEGMFSHGQWQLLSIARAIVKNPKILLLDEITANLDVQTEQIVLQAIDRVCEKRTVLTISHRLYETGFRRVIQLEQNSH